MSGRLQRTVPDLRHQPERKQLYLYDNHDRFALGRTAQAQKHVALARNKTLRNRINGRPKATYVKTKEARAQQPKDCACERHPTLSELPEHETSAACLRGVRLLR